jgi:hypothetical protein
MYTHTHTHTHTQGAPGVLQSAEREGGTEAGGEAGHARGGCRRRDRYFALLVQELTLEEALRSYAVYLLY